MQNIIYFIFTENRIVKNFRVNALYVENIIYLSSDSHLWQLLLIHRCRWCTEHCFNMSYHQAVWEVASGALLNSNCVNSTLNKDIWCWCHPCGTSDLAHFCSYVSWQDTLDNNPTFAIFTCKIPRELLDKSL